MRNLKLVDAVIALHEIARTVEEEIGSGRLSERIRKNADTLHELSLKDARNSEVTNSIIKEIKSDLGYSRIGADAFKRGK
jgi:hypothetical protein